MTDQPIVVVHPDGELLARVVVREKPAGGKPLPFFVVC